MSFIVRSKINPKLILCTNGEFMTEALVGPVGFTVRGTAIKGYAAKVYKTRRGAEAVRGGQVIVETYARKS